MDIHVQNSQFRDIGLFENYDSLIWTDRNSANGDFELFLQPNDSNRELLKNGSYLSIPSSDRTMFLETEFEDDRIKVTGNSLESVLARRVIEGFGPSAPTSLTDFINKLVLYNIGTAATVMERRITNFQTNVFIPEGFVDPTTYDAVKYGEILYDVIKNLCDNANLGFRIINQPQTSTMLFELTYGRDLTVPLGDPVHFSESIGNIHDVTHLRSDSTLKNVATVNLPPWDDTPGLGELWRVHKGDTVPSGLQRREVWTDASDLRKDESFNVSNKPGRAISWGEQELTLHPSANEVDFQLTKTNPYKYGEHYRLGDIVKVIGPTGEGVNHRVTEYIQSFGPEGNAAYPTLTAV